MSTLLGMREKQIADGHQDRSFLEDPYVHPTGSPVQATLYGKDENILLPKQLPLTLSQLGKPANDDWTLERGWVEHVEIEGTGKLAITPSCRVLLMTEVGYEFFAVPSGAFWTNLPTGGYQINRAVISILAGGLTTPTGSFTPPGTGSPASGFYVRTRYSILFTFNADKVPFTTFGPGWLQIGPNLDF